MRSAFDRLSSRRRNAILAVVGVLAMLTATAATAAVTGFEDVPDDHLFGSEIEWLADMDITRGCNPPANDMFCPDNFVTRGQMAAFLYRFANNADLRGPEGPEGPEGPQGPQGPAGEDGYVGNILHNSYSTSIPAHSHGRVAATCAYTEDAGLPETTNYPIGGDAPNGAADGYVAVGGGYSVGNGSGSVNGLDISMSRAELTYTQGRGWLVAGHNETDDPINVWAWVICVYAPDDDPTD